MIFIATLRKLMVLLLIIIIVIWLLALDWLIDDYWLILIPGTW